MKMKFVAKKALGVLCFIAAFAVAIAVTMLLWNALIPSIVGWTTISYCQAAGLLILSRLLFGGFRGFGWRHRGYHHHHKGHFRLREKMKGMSRQERREFFRQQMQKESPFDDVSFDKDRAEDKTGNN